MLNKIFYIIIIILMLWIGLSISKPSQFGYAPSAVSWSEGSGVFHSSTTISATGTILARNVDRIYASICNDSEGVIYLYQTSTFAGAVVDGQGYRLNVDACYEITRDNLYLGAVVGSASGTSIVNTLEVAK